MDCSCHDDLSAAVACTSLRSNLIGRVWEPFVLVMRAISVIYKQGDLRLPVAEGLGVGIWLPGEFVGVSL